VGRSIDGLVMVLLGGVQTLSGPVVGAALFTSGYLMVSGQLKDAGRLRMVITLTFGLVHGFGFAADLLAMQLPPQRLAELLVGFNLGVEVGQLTLVVGATLLVVALSRVNATKERRIAIVGSVNEGINRSR